MSRTILPPEWAPQSGVMMTWPHQNSDWRNVLHEVEPVYINIARHITPREMLLINCRDQNLIDHVKACLHSANIDLNKVIFSIVDSNDTWTRDYGPLTVLKDGSPYMLDFTFNGWGGKFDAGLDNQVTRHLHRSGEFGRTPLDGVDMVLEGGSIEVDGQGNLLTTAQCLLAPTRNPELDRQEIEARLRLWFGVTNVIWLEHGHLRGDDTDSHIDTLARFCDPHTIAYVACDKPEDEHYSGLRQMETELRTCRNNDGEPYRLVPLPWPGPKFDSDDGRRLAASYANFLIINGAVLVPTYDDPADDVALQRLQPCFPDREVIGIPCLPLIRQNGSLHCITMQIPAGVL